MPITTEGATESIALFTASKPTWPRAGHLNLRQCRIRRVVRKNVWCCGASGLPPKAQKNQSQKSRDRRSRRNRVGVIGRTQANVTFCA